MSKTQKPRKSFKDRYEKIAASKWFKQAYAGKSLGIPLVFRDYF